MPDRPRSQGRPDRRRGTRPDPRRAAVAGRVRRRAPCSGRRSPSPGARSSDRRAPPASSTGARWRGSRSRGSGRRPGRSRRSELRAAEGEYAAAMERVVPALAAHLGTELPGVVDRVAVVNRGEWVQANTVAFAHIIGKLEDSLLEQMLPEGAGFGKATMTLANRWVTTRQLGLLLGFMGQRVLGQYDLALLSAETTPGAPAVRRGEHPPDGEGARRADRAVPDLDRAPRDDPRVRVRGPSVAAPVPRGAARAAGLDVLGRTRARSAGTR